MANQRAPLEFNSISGGIVTEASALTFPDNASIDEVNFELSKEGTRRRRLGFQQEVSGTDFTLPSLYSGVAQTRVNAFLWGNVGGRSGLEVLVVQVMGDVHYYDASVEPISAGKFDEVTTVYDVSLTDVPVFDFANIDGSLVIVSGLSEVIVISPTFSLEGALSLTREDPAFLTIRDLFGIPIKYDRGVEKEPYVEDFITITDAEYITKRPDVDGIPSSEIVLDFVPVTTDSTETWSIDISTGSHAPRTTVTTYGMSLSRGNFSPSSILGHDILEISTTTVSSVDYNGIPISGQRPSNAVVTFNTIPPFNSLTVLDVNTGFTHVFTQDEDDGRFFRKGAISSWEDAVPSGFNLQLFIDGASVSSSQYLYNLRNQTFGVKRLEKTGSVLKDTVSSFSEEADLLPSMSDSIISAFYNNVEDSGNKTVERFHAEDLISNPTGSAPAPKGYFIIDALARSDSRETRWKELADDQGYAGEGLGLPVDKTPHGARAVAEFGGRLWYGGFSEEGSYTEPGGTRLESYLLFSQLSNSKSVLTKCYQKGDPTSVEAPELLDTDGGFISLDGAYGITKLVPLGNSLLAFGTNGVWSISGYDGNYFTPTAPRVQLVTSKGSVSPRAIVVIDSIVMYWSKDGIYIITQSDLGSYNVESLTEKTIQSLYNDIPVTTKVDAFGEYDPYTSKVSWYVYNTPNRASNTTVLSLLTSTGAFTVHEISDGDVARTLVGPVEVSPFTLGSDFVNIVVDGVQVVVGELNVVATQTNAIARTLSTKSLFISDNGVGGSLLSFGEFSNEEFMDWGEVDAPAHIITGYVSGGDFQRHKKTPYITFHFEKTESGFLCPDMEAIHQSSCLVQAQWDWSDSVNSGRWSREFQAYRFRRHYIPASLDDGFDNGFSTVVTKNKIRGKGRVLSLKLSTEPEKDCRIIGWSAIMEVNANV